MQMVMGIRLPVGQMCPIIVKGDKQYMGFKDSMEELDRAIK
jgi:hypothetical protein